MSWNEIASGAESGLSKQRLFIKRERIRRALINTKAGETICLQDWEVEILLKWIKELEKKGAKK